MRIEFSDHGDVIVARLSGDIDFSGADDLVHDILEGVPDKMAGVVIDFAAVRYVDSFGVRALFDIAGHLDTSGRRCALAVPEASPIRRLIKITRLEEVALLCDTAEECAEMVRAR